MANTILNQSTAVSLQLTDYALLWQGGQSPSTRKMPISNLATYYLALTGGTVTGDITFSAAKPKIKGNAGTVRAIQLLTGSTVRWQLDANATAESGTNAGSDFELWSYTDAGAQLTKVLAITRSSGAVAITGAVSVSGAATFSSTGAFTGAVTAANGTTGTQVVNFSQFNPSVNSTGYTKLPGGLILQWGSLGNASQDFGVSFPIVFPTAVFSIVATVQNTAFSSANTVALSGSNAGGFVAHTQGGVNISWMAIGN